ncbi:MAG: desulfoferrodoxin [Bdellovibrionota bacterium]
MTKQFEVYKCEICGNIVEVLEEAGGELYCCGEPMELKAPKSADEGLEKHVPVIETLEKSDCDSGKRRLIKVGDIAHPMELKHYINWIEVIKPSKKIARKNLNPNQEPSMEFKIEEDGEYTVRAYCNLHGLWETKYRA